jgi:hypothetical protein
MFFILGHCYILFIVFVCIISSVLFGICSLHLFCVKLTFYSFSARFATIKILYPCRLPYFHVSNKEEEVFGDFKMGSFYPQIHKQDNKVLSILLPFYFFFPMQ